MISVQISYNKCPTYYILLVAHDRLVFSLPAYSEIFKVSSLTVAVVEVGVVVVVVAVRVEIALYIHAGNDIFSESCIDIH